MTKKLVYPVAGTQLIDRALMSDADWLTDEMRTEIADDLRLLRNAIAASVGGRNLRRRPTTDEFEKSSAYGSGHDEGDSLLMNWFRENRDLAGPSGMLLPTFEMADRALKAVLLPPDEDGKQRSRYEKMSAERRRAYGIPDGYLNQDKLNALAWTVGLPPGYLLLQFRVDHVLVGHKWEEAPIRPWLRDALDFQLRQLGIEPHVPNPQPAVPLVELPKAAPTKSTKTAANRQLAAKAVARIREIRDQLGDNDAFFAVFGGRREFTERFGTQAGRGAQQGKRVPVLSDSTMQRYLNHPVEGKSDWMLASDTRLPGVRDTARINELVAAIEPHLPEADTVCTDADLEAITSSLRIQTLFDSIPTSSAAPSEARRSQSDDSGTSRPDSIDPRN